MPKLRHIATRERVSIDPEKWEETFGPTDDLTVAVRRWVVQLINNSDAADAGAIVSARRDQT